MRALLLVCSPFLCCVAQMVLLSYSDMLHLCVGSFAAGQRFKQRSSLDVVLCDCVACRGVVAGTFARCCGICHHQQAVCHRLHHQARFVDSSRLCWLHSLWSIVRWCAHATGAIVGYIAKQELCVMTVLSSSTRRGV